MTDLSRRDVLASAAGTAALGLTGSLAFLPPAFAADLREKGFYSYSIGDIEIISLYEGIWEKAHDPNFAVGGSVDDAKAALRASGLSDAFVPIEFAFTVVKTGGKTILIDAGTGGHFDQIGGKGAASMAAAGLSVDDIDTVLVSHFHPDHIYGLMEKETNAQIFPNAEIMVGEEEYAYWTDPAVVATLPERRQASAKRVQETFPTWPNIAQYQADSDLVPGIRSVATPGHTPGHMAFHLASGDVELMILGDLLIVPALFLTHLDWQLAFDADRDQASETRKAMVDRVVSDGITIAGYHFGFPNSGKIEKDGDGYVFVPVSV